MELQKGPSHPCCNSRSSPTYPSPLERKHESPAHIQRSPVSASYLERRDPFPAWWGKHSRRSVTPQEEVLSTGKARGTPGSCHHCQGPPDVSVHSRETCFPCTASAFKPTIGYLWESSQNQISKEESGVHRSDRQICLISNSAPEGTGFAPLVHVTRKSFINDDKQQVEKTSTLNLSRHEA